MAKRKPIPTKVMKATMPRKPRGKKVVVRGLLEDKRLVRGPSLVTPSAEDSRALNPERRRKKAPKQVQGQVRGLLEDKMLPRGPGLVTPSAEESRALNPERVRGRPSKKVQGPRIRESTPEEIKAAEDEFKRQIAEIDAEEAARGRNAGGRAAVEALRKKAMADFVAATRAPSAEPPGPDLGPGPERQRDYLPEGLQPRLEKTMGEKIKPFAVGGGLAALAGLGVARGVDAYNTNRAAQDIRFDTERVSRESLLAGLVNQGRERSLQNAIQANLAEVQRQSPFLYNQVAAGRVLPQGAVVLGGRTRQDLLQELGRSMSEGQFSQ